jgi:phosphatidate phosphatase PAH1
MKAIFSRLAQNTGTALWNGTTRVTDSGGGATDVIVVRHASGRMMCSSFHAQLPRISNRSNDILMGTRVQIFVNNVPTGVNMVLDKNLICCFEDGSYRASSEDLESMGLRPGKNSIRYEMIHSLNNDRRYSVKADIHLWNSWDKIVVVDIDGTVTKTDVAGFGAEKLGYEYIHQGVCEAVSHISKLGYRILFLTSRAITLAQSTREFLRSIGFANGGTGMPEFALITTTERFLQSLVVGVRSADKFKTVALTEILRIFQPEHPASRRPDGDSYEEVPGWRQDTSPFQQRSPSCFASGDSKTASGIWHGPSDAEDDEASNASTADVDDAVPISALSY